MVKFLQLCVVKLSFGPLPLDIDDIFHERPLILCKQIKRSNYIKCTLQKWRCLLFYYEMHSDAIYSDVRYILDALINFKSFSWCIKLVCYPYFLLYSTCPSSKSKWEGFETWRKEGFKNLWKGFTVRKKVLNLWNIRWISDRNRKPNLTAYFK